MHRATPTLAACLLVLFAGCSGAFGGTTTTPASGYVEVRVETPPETATVYEYDGPRVGESTVLERAFRDASGAGDTAIVGLNGSERVELQERLPDAEPSAGVVDGYYVAYGNETYRVFVAVAAAE